VAIRLRFDPVTSDGGRIEVPFTFVSSRDDAEPVHAALRLQTPRHPLAIAFHEGIGDRQLARAWVVALAGFAQLTCVGLSNDAVVSRGDRSISAPHFIADRASAPRQPRGVGRRSVFSAALRPIGATAQIASSYVAGHRRRLRPGQRCSDEAKAAARAVGIELQGTETRVCRTLAGFPMTPSSSSLGRFQGSCVSRPVRRIDVQTGGTPSTRTAAHLRLKSGRAPPSLRIVRSCDRETCDLIGSFARVAFNLWGHFRGLSLVVPRGCLGTSLFGVLAARDRVVAACIGGGGQLSGVR
jgi:hypothetical protein